MKRYEAERVLLEMMEADSLGIMGSMSDEQVEALKMAYNALKTPESMTCAYCQKMVNEDAEGNGWCEEHDRAAHCDDFACRKYE